MILELQPKQDLKLLAATGNKQWLVDGYWLSFEKLKYHASWNWLMLVVEKIEKDFHLSIDIYENNCDIIPIGAEDDSMPWLTGLEPIYTEAVSKIKAVYESVLQFINWYNNHKQ